jgi:hypothetical protein
VVAGASVNPVSRGAAARKPQIKDINMKGKRNLI